MIKEESIPIQIESFVFDTLLEIIKEMDKEEHEEGIFITDVTGCLRASYYRKVLGERLPEKIRFQTLIGKATHEFLIPRLAFRLGGDIEVRTEYRGIRGRADIVTKDYVIELKTVSNIPTTVYRSHAEQLNFYLFALKKEYGYVVYLNRKTGVVRVREVKKDEKLLEITLVKAKELKEAIENKIPPKPHVPIRELKTLCSYCPFNSECLKETLSESIEMMMYDDFNM